jgi:hypothetical protein
MLYNTIIAILPLFALIAVGLVARKTRLLHRADSGVLSRFAVQIALPGLIISSLLCKTFVRAEAELPTLYWIAQFVAFGCVLIARPLIKLDKHSTGAAMLMTFGNTGFMGYPMTTALFPNMLPAAVFIDQIGMSLILYPAAIVLASLYGEDADKSVSPLRELGVMLRSPVFVALGLGILLKILFTFEPKWLQLPLSRLGVDFLTMIGAATIPVVLVSIGMRLSGAGARRHLGQIGAIGLIKLVVMPLICLLVGRYLYHLSGNLLGVIVLEAAMPPAAVATIFAGQYRMNSDLAVGSFFVLTLASAVTLPLILSLLH